MDILLLALLNVLLFFCIGVWEYMTYIKRKEVFFNRIPVQKGSAFNKLFIYFPSFLYSYIKKYANKKEKNVNKNFSNDFSPFKLLLLNGALIISAINLQNLLKLPWYFTLIVGFLMQSVLYLQAKNKQKKVKEVIEKTLPEILDVMARVYRVHTDLRICLQEVANTIYEPVIKDKFNEMVRLSRFGYTTEEAMDHISKEINSSDFDFIITSIKLNIPVGGDLSHLFEHTAQLLRQRKEAKNEIQNLMFQSKISSIISALLVPAIIVVAFTSSKKYQEVLLYNPTGRLVFFGCLIWWFIGVIMIRKSSRIKI